MVEEEERGREETAVKGWKPLISSEEFDAVVFDLDGVITDTAELHFQAWKEVFDEKLKEVGEDRPFEREDYLRFVDGMPRQEGVESFLRSRGLSLKKSEEIGARKNEKFQELLEQGKAEVFGGAKDLVEQLLRQGIKTALVSSSRNAKRVLEALKLDHLFDERVDGESLEALNLRGKPAPDLFLEALGRLRVRPDRAVVIEDARSGVEAGRAGGFRLVIGVAREERDRRALLARGADLTVGDLSELMTLH